MSDVILTSGSGGINRRYEDIGDGSYAEVVYGGASGALADTDVRLARGSLVNGVQIVTRYRDMGDGSYAEVVYSE